MAEREGVIKFQLQFSPAEPIPDRHLREINAWRRILYLTGLIGQDPGRYGGYGYGNISQRLPAREADRLGDGRFVISGTQTGQLAHLTNEHYATVLACEPDRNWVAAEGPIKPSSESLTHGAIYSLDPALRCVIHAHSPEIWQRARELDIPTTRPEVPYGTPEMAAETWRLYRESSAAGLQIMVMGGHEDGVITFGRTVEAAGLVMLRYLARAL